MIARLLSVNVGLPRDIHGKGWGRGDDDSFANFSDPDGNSWVLQERGYQRL